MGFVQGNKNLIMNDSGHSTELD